MKWLDSSFCGGGETSRDTTLFLASWVVCLLSAPYKSFVWWKRPCYSKHIESWNSTTNLLGRTILLCGWWEGRGFAGNMITPPPTTTMDEDGYGVGGYWLSTSSSMNTNRTYRMTARTLRWQKRRKDQRIYGRCPFRYSRQMKWVTGISTWFYDILGG